MFHSARIKLTAWYLTIIILITFVFSLSIYAVVSNQIEGFIHMQNNRIREFQQRTYSLPPPPKDGPPIISVTELKKQETDLIYRLIFIDIFIFTFSGLAGYFLAGRTLRPIKIMMEEQNQFISNSSHELRTPIATLRAEMEGSLMEKYLSDTTARKLIESNLEEVKNLQELSNSLLEITKIHDINPQKKEKVSLNEVLDLSVKKVQVLFKKKNITIHKNFTTDAIIIGDKGRLVELFIILLDNAIKYSNDNSNITLDIEKISGQIRINIKDEGIGISKEDLPHIFERFYRADKSRRDTQGYGLGLSIAKKIIDSHRGSIKAESIPDKGSVFTVLLPLV